MHHLNCCRSLQCTASRQKSLQWWSGQGTHHSCHYTNRTGSGRDQGCTASSNPAGSAKTPLSKCFKHDIGWPPPPVSQGSRPSEFTNEAPVAWGVWARILTIRHAVGPYRARGARQSPCQKPQLLGGGLPTNFQHLSPAPRIPTDLILRACAWSGTDSAQFKNSRAVVEFARVQNVQRGKKGLLRLQATVCGWE